MKDNENANIAKQWLSTSELADIYGFSKSTQAKLRMKRKIPFSKVGSRILYQNSKIISWLENNSIDVVA